MPSYRSVRLPPRRRAAPGSGNPPDTVGVPRGAARSCVGSPERPTASRRGRRRSSRGRRAQGEGCAVAPFGRWGTDAPVRYLQALLDPQGNQTRLSVPHSGAEVSGNPPVQITGLQSPKLTRLTLFSILSRSQNRV